MKTIAIIPARGNSKRLPNKNVKLLSGLPLLAYSIKYAKQHDFVAAVYVTTDNEEVKKVALDYGAIVIDRPKELSGDFEPTVTALKHVLEFIRDKVENVILLQPTNPLRPKHLLNSAFEAYSLNKCDSLFTVSRNRDKFGTIENQKFKPYNYAIGQRSQDLMPLYSENGLLYITKANYIINQEIITSDAYPFIVNHPFGTLDIDFLDDFDLAEFMVKKYYDE